MAGHSKFKNIMFRKGAQDKKRSKLFSKLSREITVAAKSGMPDPAANARLRSAVLAARTQNMPRDRIERAIQKSQEVGGSDWQSMRYEGFGAGGIAVIVEALTDNKNRTASELRTIFFKFGGGMGESGSAEHMFTRCGVLHYSLAAASVEHAFENAVSAGADDCTSDDEVHEIICAASDFHVVRSALEETLGEPVLAELQYRPAVEVEVDAEVLRVLLGMIDALEDNEDVQNVWSNYTAPDSVMEAVLAEG